MSLFSRVRNAALALYRNAFSRTVTGSAASDHLEVERKFKVSEAEAQRVPARLEAMGFVPQGRAYMEDIFLPGSRDGEMMRIRRERIDDGPESIVLTMKRWVVTANGGKERREAERTVRPLVASMWSIVGRMLSGRPHNGFSKIRDLFAAERGGQRFIVSVDDVSGLGQFSGTYLEIEAIMPRGADTSAVVAEIFKLVNEILGEPRPDEKQSYRDMLLKSVSS